MISEHIVDLAVRQFVQVSILIVGVGLVTRIFCRRRPHLAYVLWILVLIKSLTPPVWSSPTGIFSWAEFHRKIAPTEPARAASIRWMPMETAPGAALSMPRVSVIQSDVLRRYSWQIWQIVLVIWAVGGCAVVLVAVGSSLMLRRRIERCSLRAPVELSNMLGELSRSLGAHRRVRLRLCSDPIGPAVLGVFRPVLILPATILQQKDLSQIEAVLAHEIIHLRRGDPLIAGVQLLSGAVWWFHPLAWWMNRQISRVREWCCDAEVLASLRCPAVNYAQMLIDVLRGRRVFYPAPLALWIHPAQVTAQRLQQIMSGSRWGGQRMARRDWALVALLGLLILPGAGISRGGATTAAAASAEDNSEIPGPALNPTTKPSPTWFVRHFVAVVVDIDGITYQGQRIDLDKLKSLLQQVPDRAHTVLQLSYASGDVTMRQFNDVQSRAIQLVQELGYEYLSYTGQHPADSKGSPDRVVAELAAPPVKILPALPPAPLSQLTHVVNFQLGQSGFHPGDSITITEVRGTSDRFAVDGTYQVRGMYTLTSQSHATLALSVTAKDAQNGSGYWGEQQTIKITRGSGTFTLIERMACEGYPHVSFYDETSSFGGVYFGTGSWISY